jgi:beta-glucosidase-like glycosyl hydrolase
MVKNATYLLLIFFVGLTAWTVYASIELNKKVAPVIVAPNVELVVKASTLLETIKKVPKKEKIGQLMFLGVEGAELSTQSAQLLRDIQPGGIILLPSNIKSEEQLIKLINSLQNVLSIKPFIAIDYETTTSVLPSFMPKTSIFTYLKSTGINTVFGPIIDIAAKNSYIAKRAYANEEEALQKAEIFLQEAKESNVYTTLKHYPGIGGVTEDPHRTVGIVTYATPSALFNKLAPRTHFIMSSHVKIKEASAPATFTKNYMGEISQDVIIITDDLNMQSIKNTKQKYLKALEAGHVMLLDINYLDQVSKQMVELDTLDDEALNARVEKILRKKMEYGLVERN